MNERGRRWRRDRGGRRPGRPPLRRAGRPLGRFVIRSGFGARLARPAAPVGATPATPRSSSRSGPTALGSLTKIRAPATYPATGPSMWPLPGAPVNRWASDVPQGEPRSDGAMARGPKDRRVQDEPAPFPRGSDLLTEFLPFDRATLEDAIDRFLAPLEELGSELAVGRREPAPHGDGCRHRGPGVGSDAAADPGRQDDARRRGRGLRPIPRLSFGLEARRVMSTPSLETLLEKLANGEPEAAERGLPRIRAVPPLDGAAEVDADAPRQVRLDGRRAVGLGRRAGGIPRGGLAVHRQAHLRAFLAQVTYNHFATHCRRHARPSSRTGR